jgi:hypothetical protein
MKVYQLDNKPSTSLLLFFQFSYMVSNSSLLFMSISILILLYNMDKENVPFHVFFFEKVLNLFFWNNIFLNYIHNESFEGIDY